MSVPPVTGKSSLLYFIDRLRKAHPAPFDEHILLVHEVCMDQEGIDAVKEVMRHPYVALCPCSNIFIHNTLPPVDLMRRNGLKITVGTDSLSSNDDLDMVRELYCLQRLVSGRTSYMGLRQRSGIPRKRKDSRHDRHREVPRSRVY